MKKLFLIAAVAFGMVANAQETKKEYLPKKGDWSISFDAKPIFNYVGNLFNEAGTNNIGLGLNPSYAEAGLYEFVGKIMDEDNMATRYIVGFKSEFSRINESNETLTEVSKGKSLFNLVAGMGKEWRKGSSRLQGYYGADILGGLFIDRDLTKTVSYKSDNGKRGAEDFTTRLRANSYELGVGARAFVGVEYFIFPKVSLGAEYNLTGFLSYNFGKGGSFDSTAEGFEEPETFRTGGGGKLRLGTTDGGAGVATLRVAFYF